MYNKIRFVPAVLAAVLAAGTVYAADKSVAVVNGVAISPDKMEFIVKKQVEQGAPDTPELRAKIREFLVSQEVLAQEASKEGLDKTADYQVESQLSHNELLGNIVLSNYVKTHPISDDDIKAEYDKKVAEMGDHKEYHARHILVKTEAEANAILAQLKKGKSFDTLAKEKSTDPGSKDNGGDLGWTQPERFVKEFSEAMVKLSKGQITQTAVKTQFGYHIIKLEDVRSSQPPAFEQVKAQIQQGLLREQVENFKKDLAAKAKVE